MQVNHAICTDFMLQNIKEHLTTAIQMWYICHRKQSQPIWRFCRTLTDISGQIRTKTDKS